jgi:hypothetical protein
MKAGWRVQELFTAERAEYAEPHLKVLCELGVLRGAELLDRDEHRGHLGICDMVPTRPLPVQ